jgi:hypothetical protein
MQIDPSFNGRPIPGRKIGRPAQGASSASRAPSDQSAGSGETIPAENAALIVALRDFPDVRPELVEDVRQRLDRGEFLTRDAAEKTAEAILSDLASFIGS